MLGACPGAGRLQRQGGSLAMIAATSHPLARRSRGPLRGRTTPYLFLLPFGVLFLAFFIAPILYALKLSLYVVHRHPSLNGATSTTSFSGLDNFHRAFTDSGF